MRNGAYFASLDNYNLQKTVCANSGKLQYCRSPRGGV